MIFDRLRFNAKIVFFVYLNNFFASLSETAISLALVKTNRPMSATEMF